MTETGPDPGLGHLSCSQAKLLLPPSCPAKYRQSLREAPTQSAVFDFGKLAHLMVLGTGDEIEVIHADDYKTAAAKAARDRAYLEGKVPVLPHQVDTAALMAAAVADHPVAGSLFAKGHAEVPVDVVDPSTGVQLHGRMDWLTMLDGKAVIVEYKTAVDAYPRHWVRTAVKYGYVLQHGWYVTAAELAGIDIGVRMLFVVQEKVPPYVVSVVEFDERAVDYGRQQMRHAIDLFVACRQADVWPGYDEKIAGVELPPWVYR